MRPVVVALFAFVESETAKMAAAIRGAGIQQF